MPRYFAAAFVAACLAVAGFIAWGLPTQVRVAVPPLPSVTRTTHATTTTVDWKPAVRYATAVAQQRELIRAIKWASGLAHASQQQRLETNSHHVRTVPIPAAVSNACPYAALIRSIWQRDATWATAIAWRESRCQPGAYNPSSASGLFQIEANSWHGDCPWSSRFDAACNVRAAWALYLTRGRAPWAL